MAKNIEEQRPQKSQRVILQHTEEAALTQLNRTSWGLTLSGLSAGLDIGFSVFFMATMLSLFKDAVSGAVLHVLLSVMYPIGFIFVILGRSELFTEHTTLAMLPVLQRLAGIKKLLRLWMYVYFSNVLGGSIFAFILFYFAEHMHFLETSALREIGTGMIVSNGLTTFLSATLAGWLMGLLAWLVAASRDTISQLSLILIITTAIGLGGFPHCIVGNVEVMTVLFTGDLSFMQYLQFMLLATAGNIIGGVFFVAVLKYSHTQQSGKEEEVHLDDDM